MCSKQAENGLQSRSSENGKTAVWHYGLKLLWYLTGDRGWRYGMVWFGFVGIVWYGGGGSWLALMTDMDDEISIMDYNGQSWTIIEGGRVMTSMDDWTLLFISYFFILLTYGLTDRQTLVLVKLLSQLKSVTLLVLKISIFKIKNIWPQKYFVQNKDYI